MKEKEPTVSKTMLLPKSVAEQVSLIAEKEDRSFGYISATLIKQGILSRKENK